VDGGDVEPAGACEGGGVSGDGEVGAAVSGDGEGDGGRELGEGERAACGEPVDGGGVVMAGDAAVVGEP
jgi:hypothetical protein